MGKEQITDEMLYKYMPIVDDAIIKRLEQEVDTSYKFSKEFERKMKLLIQKEAHPILYTIGNIMRKAAIFLIGLLGASFVLTMSVEAYRENLFRTIKTRLEDSVLYSYVTEQEEDEFTIREPDYLPRGYKRTLKLENDIVITFYYENHLEEQIIWRQYFIRDGKEIVLDSEYDSVEAMEIHGSTATIYLYNGGFAMAYYEYDDSVYVITADRVSSKDLFKMLKSIK